ncbi:MAG TPA: Nif3-like dinuclear metal center hexameric protein, partial [Lacipirellulaceae bacterium]|nr:Nif3-like dinuclear metal center hexameric protein [Lacipirellulaceae bacterium]
LGGAGLLVGEAQWPADRVMTCLTVTPTTVAEAVERGAQLIITHHPLPFRPVASLTGATTVGRLLLELARHAIAVYSPHTAFDSAPAGINQHIAIGLGLQEIRPLEPAASDPDARAGRCGQAGEPVTLAELARRAAEFLSAGNRVAVACGRGGSLLDGAVQAGCDALVTGELSLHGCLEAEARGLGVVLAGHFASEHFALLALADYVTDQLADVEVWPCRSERDPIESL